MESYQISLEDVQAVNSIVSQPGRTAFIDESGSFGFDFDADGNSSHYVVCAVVVKNEEITHIEQKIDDLRKRNFGTGEMKSSLIGANHGRRAKILTELLLLDFSLILLIADKQAFYTQSPLAMYKDPFVKYLHQKLYESMYYTYPKLKIVEDEYGTCEFQKEYRKYIEEHRPRPNMLNEYDFDFSNSRYSNIVQIADIVAGSARQRILNPEAPDALRILSGKILDIINFPKPFEQNIVEADIDKSFDDQIYNLAQGCAMNYIESNMSAEEEEIRLRVLFLRQLLFTVRNISKTSFAYAAEIAQQMSKLFNRHITPNYLYRKVIPQLRDADVLIASCGYGYKIPTSLDDIYKYINQTSGIVNPMLSRIERCRNLINKQTDGTLDILNDPVFAKYKRYFGDY